MEDLLTAAEWAIMLCETVDQFPLVGSTPLGEVRAFKLTTIPPGVIVVFGSEEHGDGRKVLLLDCRVPEPSEED